MNDDITIPRATVEALLTVAKNVLEHTNPAAPDRLERAEVTVVNNTRNKLREAVYQAEKALFHDDIKPLTAEQMSRNATAKHEFEDFSANKTNFIEGRR